MAQQRVFEEIKRDLNQKKPMLRLVQGDVGSGKTVIAALAAVQAIANGYQVALMAPTDSPAKEVFEGICKPLIAVQNSIQQNLKKSHQASLRWLFCQLVEHHVRQAAYVHLIFSN